MIVKKVFDGALPRVSVKLLDALIAIGIAAMAVLIPILSAKGGFTVEFDANGGSYVEPLRLRYGESIEEPEAPVREDYEFAGWAYDAEGRKRFDFDGAEAVGDITLFAVWRETAEETE